MSGEKQDKTVKFERVKFERRHHNEMAKSLNRAYYGAMASGNYTSEQLGQFAEGFEAAVSSLIEMLEEDNPNFSALRFYNAVISDQGQGRDKYAAIDDKLDPTATEEL